MKAIDRFYEYLAEKSLKPTAIEKNIGLSNGYLSAQKKRGADIGEGMMLKIIDYFRDISPLWLLTGEGPMLRNSKTSEETTMNHGTEKVQSTSSDTIALRMMDKLDEKDNIIKEKDAKIDQLQSELRAQSAELAVLKAKYQDKESGFKFPNIIEDFTSESSGDYGEGYSPTKPHTTSKRSSVGKI